MSISKKDFLALINDLTALVMKETWAVAKIDVNYKGNIPYTDYVLDESENPTAAEKKRFEEYKQAWDNLRLKHDGNSDLKNKTTPGEKKQFAKYKKACNELRLKRNDPKFKENLAEHLSKKIKVYLEKMQEEEEGDWDLADFWTKKSTPLSGFLVLWKYAYSEFDFTPKEYRKLLIQYKFIIDNMTSTDSNMDNTYSKARDPIKKKHGVNSVEYTLSIKEIFGIGQEKRWELDAAKKEKVETKKKIKFEESETFEIIERTRRSDSVQDAIICLALCTGSRKIELLKQSSSDYAKLTKVNAETDREKEILENSRKVDKVVPMKVYGVAKESLSKKFDPENRKTIVKPLLVISWDEFQEKLKMIRDEVAKYEKKNGEKDNKTLGTARPFNEKLTKAIDLLAEDFKSLADVQKKKNKETGKITGEGKLHFFRKLYVSLAMTLAGEVWEMTDQPFIREILGHEKMEMGATYNIVKPVNSDYKKNADDSEDVKKLKIDNTATKAEVRVLDQELKNTKSELKDVKTRVETEAELAAEREKERAKEAREIEKQRELLAKEKEQRKKDREKDAEKAEKAKDKEEKRKEKTSTSQKVKDPDKVEVTQDDIDAYIEMYRRNDLKAGHKRLSKHVGKMSVTDHVIRIRAGIAMIMKYKDKIPALKKMKRVISDAGFKVIGLGARSFSFYKEFLEAKDKDGEK